MKNRSLPLIAIFLVAVGLQGTISTANAQSASYTECINSVNEAKKQAMLQAESRIAALGGYGNSTANQELQQIEQYYNALSASCTVPSTPTFVQTTNSNSQYQYLDDFYTYASKLSDIVSTSLDEYSAHLKQSTSNYETYLSKSSDMVALSIAVTTEKSKQAVATEKLTEESNERVKQSALEVLESAKEHLLSASNDLVAKGVQDPGNVFQLTMDYFASISDSIQKETDITKTYLRALRDNFIQENEKPKATTTNTSTPSLPATQLPTGTSSFTDVSTNNRFYTAVEYLKKNNIVSGYPDGTYKPDITINRAEFMKIVISTINSSPTGHGCFSDVHNEWFASFVCYGKQNGVVSGYANGTFRPNQSINLPEALKIVFIAMKTKLSSNKGTSWYDVYVNTANEIGLFTNVDSDIGHMLSRGEMAEIIYKLKTLSN